MPPAKHCIDLATCASICKRLHSFVSSISTEEAFNAYEDKAKLTMEDSSCRTEHERARERKRLFNEMYSEVGLELSPRERFRTWTFLPILDSLLTELVWRTEVAFLFTLLISSEAQLRESAWKAHFSFEIEEEVFEDEIIQLVGYIKQRATEAVSPPACLRRIREGGIP